MRIAINCLLVEPGQTGGGETFLVNLIERLARLDTKNDYLLIVTEANAPLFATTNPRFTQHVVMPSAKSRVRRLWFEYQALPHWLKRQSVDLYYSPFGTLPYGLPCKSAVTFQNLLYIDFAATTPYRGRTPISWIKISLQALYHRTTTRSTMRRADKIWAVSNTTARALSDYYDVAPSKIEVIYEGVNFERFHPERQPDLPERPFADRYVLMVASLYPNKNIDKAIVAFRSLVDRGLPHHLVIVGNDWHQYRINLEKVVERLHLGERVHFVGGVKHEDIPPYFKHAELFVMISTVESFGLPVLEAMASGVPVLISQRSSLPEIAGNAALTTDIQNTNHIADQMVRILTDRALSNSLRERGHNRARSFDWNETAARAIDLFSSVSDKPRTVPDFHGKDSIDEYRHPQIPTTTH